MGSGLSLMAVPVGAGTPGAGGGSCGGDARPEGPASPGTPGLVLTEPSCSSHMGCPSRLSFVTRFCVRGRPFQQRECWFLSKPPGCRFCPFAFWKRPPSGPINPRQAPGPTGEKDQADCQGKGVRLVTSFLNPVLRQLGGWQGACGPQGRHLVWGGPPLGVFLTLPLSGSWGEPCSWGRLLLGVEPPCGRRPVRGRLVSLPLAQPRVPEWKTMGGASTVQQPRRVALGQGDRDPESTQTRGPAWSALPTVTIVAVSGPRMLVPSRVWGGAASTALPPHTGWSGCRVPTNGFFSGTLLRCNSHAV